MNAFLESGNIFKFFFHFLKDEKRNPLPRILKNSEFFKRRKCDFDSSPSEFMPRISLVPAARKAFTDAAQQCDCGPG